MMTMMTSTMTRGRGRSRRRNLSGAEAGAGNFKNGRLRQPWNFKVALCYKWIGFFFAYPDPGFNSLDPSINTLMESK